MTKPLNPEIKALRAVVRALAPLDREQQQRSMEWLVARALGWPGATLPPVNLAAVSREDGPA